MAHDAQIHILDGQNDVILDFITAKNIIDDTHKKSLEDTLETYEFITFADRRFSQYLEKRNRIIIPDEDETLREFVIFEAAKYRDAEGYKAQVFSHASYLELKKARILYPTRREGLTASQHAGWALNDTGWTVGIVEAEGTRTFTIEKHTNPYEFLKRIANEFEVELRFRIEHDGQRITGRYVDLLERIGEWRGREIEFGKDLDGIRRVEKQDIVTALLGLGPEREDGTRIEVLVEDEEALQRWGRIDEYGNLHHLIEPYEIQSERSEMTESEARQYTRTALNKRINTQVTYETTILDLEEVPGMENKQIRFGDTIKIKDTSFNPPLFLEARVFEQSRSIKSKAKKDIKLGDFIEYTEEEVTAIWKQLEARIKERITAQELYEYTYEKLVIDNKDEAVRTDVTSYANTVADDAKDEAITYTNNTVDPIIVSVSDLVDEVQVHEGLITQAQTDITQAFDEIELRATKTELDTVEQRVEDAEGEITVLAGEVELKANQTVVDALEGRVSTAESSISVLSDEIDLKVDVEGVIAAINLSSETAKIQAENIELIGAVTVLSDITGNLGDITAGHLDGVRITSQASDGGVVEIENGVIKTARDSTYLVGSVLEKDQFEMYLANPEGDREFSATLTRTELELQHAFGSSRTYYTSTGVLGRFRERILYLEEDSTNTFTGNVLMEPPGHLEIRTTNNPASGQPIMLVKSAGGSERFRVEHDGKVSTTNSTLSINGADITRNDFYLDIDRNLRANGEIVATNGDVFTQSNGTFTSQSGYVVLRAPSSVIYLQSDSEVRATKVGSTSNYTDLRANAVRAHGWVYTDAVDILTGTHLYARPTSSGKLRVTVTGTTGNFRPVEASGYENGSLEEYKQDIELWNDSALDLIRGSEIYQYRLKQDVENGINKLKYSLVIGEGYSTPEEVLNPEKTSVDIYVQTSIAWKAIQELAEENQNLKTRVEALEAQLS